MEKEIVKFVSSIPYLVISDEAFAKVFFCVHGRKEVVVECSEELKEILRNLPSDYLQPRLVDMRNYLDKVGIKYIENF